MIADKRTGLPLISKGLFSPDESLPVIQKPALSGWARNGVISGKSHPATGTPLYLDTNLINRFEKPIGFMFMYDDDLSDPGPRVLGKTMSPLVMPSTIALINGNAWSNPGGYVGYGQPGIPKKATRYRFFTKNGYTPRTWRFEGANDANGPWTTLDTQTYVDTWPDGVTCYDGTISAENQDYFQFWRLIFDAFDATSVSIYSLLIFQGEPEDDGKVFIDASPEYPLVLSFADGYSGGDPVNHIVTVTERREIYIEQAWRDIGLWSPTMGLGNDFNSIVAEFDPSSGEVSFMAPQEVLIQPDADDAFAADKDWEVIYNRYINTDHYLKEAFNLTPGDYFRGSSYDNEGYSRVKRRDDTPFWFNKHYWRKRRVAYHRSGIGIREALSKFDSPLPASATDIDRTYTVIHDSPESDDWYDEAIGNSSSYRNMMLLSLYPFCCRAVDFICWGYYNTTYNFVYNLNCGADLGIGLNYDPSDGKMYFIDPATGARTHKRWAVIGQGLVTSNWHANTAAGFALWEENQIQIVPRLRCLPFGLHGMGQQNMIFTDLDHKYSNTYYGVCSRGLDTQEFGFAYAD